MTEQEIMQRERELLERERDLLEREKALFKAEIESVKKSNKTEGHNKSDETENQIAEQIDESSDIEEYKDVPSNDELSQDELTEILLKSEKEYKDLTSGNQRKSSLSTILLCAILILMGLTIVTLVKTKDVTMSAGNTSGTIDAIFDANSGTVITSYQNID